jgi:WD40 repeat protein
LFYENPVQVIPTRAIVNSVAFSPKGFIAAALDSGEIKLWDSQRELSLFRFNGTAKSVAFNPIDGALAAGGELFGPGSIKVWKLPEVRERTLTTASELNSLAFRPIDGALAAGLLDGNVKIWDSLGREQILNAFEHKISSVAFNPIDGVLAAAGGRSFSPGSIKIWRLPGQRAETIDTGGTIKSIAFNPINGSLAAALGYDGVKVWDPERRNYIQRYENNEYVRDVAFSPVDGSLAIAMGDKVKIETPQREEQTLNIDSKVESIAFSPINGILAAGTHAGIKLFAPISTGRSIKPAQPTRHM